MIDRVRQAAGSIAADCPTEGDGRWMNLYRSALLLLFAVTVAIVGFEGERVIGRLDGIEKAQNTSNVAAAVADSRVGSLERSDARQWESIDGQEHRITILEAKKR